MLGGQPLSIEFGAATNISFTACDVEGLPLRHSLPTARDGLPDPRRFSAELRNDTTGDSLEVPVDSPAGGRYIAVVTPGRLGIFSLQLRLGQTASSQLSATPAQGELLVEVVCPAGLVADPAARICTCDRGYTPKSADVVADGCVACAAGSFKPELGPAGCEPCEPGTAQPATAGVACDVCLAGTFQPERGRLSCDICGPRTNSTAPYTECDICEAGRYRTSVLVTPNAESCRSCPAGVDCPYGSTILPALFLKPGTWRLSEGARSVALCKASTNGTSPCVGGPLVGGYCREGHVGPLCEVCSEEHFYFDWWEAECKRCPAGERYLLTYALLLGLPALFCGALVLAHRRFPRVQAAWRRSKAVLDARNAEAKLKLLIGFVQVVSVIGPTYSITLPSIYRVVLQALEVFYFDFVGELVVPTECLGGYASYLLAKAISPFVLLVAAVLAYTVVNLRRAHPGRWELRKSTQSAAPPPGRGGGQRGRRVVREIAAAICRSAFNIRVNPIGMSALPLALWVGIIFCVSVSASTFNGLHCRRFLDDSDTYIYICICIDR